MRWFLRRNRFDRLIDLDSLVFSSHKTSTQSLVHSLRENGEKTRHGHLLRHIGLEEGDFPKLARAYRKRHGRSLTVYSIFREPVERLMSSFFQTHGSDMVDFGHIESKEESILCTQTNEELHETFLSGLRTKSLPGYGESLEILAAELDLDIAEQRFDASAGYTSWDEELVRLVLLRFDLLIPNYQRILTELLGTEAATAKANVSDDKWYSDAYRLFKKTIKLAEADIDAVYESKGPLLDLFYGDSREALRLKMVEKCG